jgi:hypothetical protein
MLLKQNPTDPEEIEIDIDAIDEQTLRCVLAGRIRVPTPEPNRTKRFRFRWVLPQGMPHLSRDWARFRVVPLPHLRQDWARPCHN